MAKKRRWKKPGDPRVHTAGTRSQSTDADEYFHDILELSSLGTLAARQIRSSTDADTVQDVRQRMSGREAARTLSGEDSPLPVPGTVTSYVAQAADDRPSDVPAAAPNTAQVLERDATAHIPGGTTNIEGGGQGAATETLEKKQTLKKGTRVIGVDRSRLGTLLAKRYDSGESIRSLSASTGRSYGFVHRILTDSGVDLRRRGGAARSGRTMRITGLAKKAKR
jgi:hypothetical protein